VAARLLDRSAGINTLDAYGTTLISAAARRGYDHMVAFLLERGTDELRKDTRFDEREACAELPTAWESTGHPRATDDPGNSESPHANLLRDSSLHPTYWGVWRTLDKVRAKAPPWWPMAPRPTPGSKRPQARTVATSASHGDGKWPQA